MKRIKLNNFLFNIPCGQIEKSIINIKKSIINFKKNKIPKKNLGKIII